MNLRIPKLSLVVLIGPSGAGKSTFARRHFRPTEVLSSDACRGMVCDDENDQTVSAEAFAVLHHIAERRLALGRLTVVDATNVQPEARAPLVALARRHHCLPVAVVLDMPEETCRARNAARPDRAFGPHVIRNQRAQLRRSLRGGGLRGEGFRHVFVLETPEQADAAAVERVPLSNDRTGESGPFDIIGDVHGCADELERLLAALGYGRTENVPAGPGWPGVGYAHPAGRKAVFLGDLVDRGPRVLDTLSIVRNMVAAGAALCVPGNHDMKLLRKLRGRDVKVSHGLAETLAEIDALPAEVRGPFTRSLADFLDGLVSHYVLDGGRLVVAHAGMKAEMQGRGSGRVRDFALYGETTGETDEFGLPVRHNWAAEYRGPAAVVYGHTPVPGPEWLNNTVNVDTGCVYGGRLTALRYPEREFVSVPAARMYCAPTRPFLPTVGEKPGALTAQQENDLLLDAADVLGKRVVATRLRGNVTVREAHATAALEVMSRFAVDPRWLIYLPPTMSPCETSRAEGLLEHPAEAFAHYRARGVARVVCQEKHMGSRAVAVVCRDAAAARARFGVTDADGPAGIVYTRTGRRFFNDDSLEAALLDRLRSALSAAGLWEELSTDWACLDCELMPWSAKAQELLRTQYAAVGSAGRAALGAAEDALTRAAGRLEGDERTLAEAALSAARVRREAVGRFADAYRRYCWPVEGLSDLRLAPFHLMATEGRVHTDKGHAWHMETLGRACREDPGLLLPTANRTVDLADESSIAAGTAWWEELTARGGEGMVVKPADFVPTGPKGLEQPAVKVRGREYLRIIYGPDYAEPGNLARLRFRGLGRKRSLALSEFALGLEGLERFVRREPLRRVHECVFAVLALESEPVDPRL
jgi:protein phosphatase